MSAQRTKSGRVSAKIKRTGLCKCQGVFRHRTNTVRYYKYEEAFGFRLHRVGSCETGVYARCKPAYEVGDLEPLDDLARAQYTEIVVMRNEMRANRG